MATPSKSPARTPGRSPIASEVRISIRISISILHFRIMRWDFATRSFFFFFIRSTFRCDSSIIITITE